MEAPFASQNTMKIRLAILLCLVVATAHAQTNGPLPTPFGELHLDKGLPATVKDSQALFDELDYQRACQCYLWALPIVSFAEWQAQHEEVFGAKDGDLVVYTTYKDKLGILTANATTTYILGFINLARTGPLLIDYPAGPSAGGVGDFWQRPLTDMGETGPDKAKGGKYLIIGPGQKVDDTTGYTVIHSPTFNINFGTRALDPDPARGRALLEKIRIYPLSRRDNPPPTRLIAVDGKSWSQVQPRGLGYWTRLHKILQIEPVEERDRIMMAMLAPLGIEKGKPFEPNEHQRKILSDGAATGELMAINFAFNKRFAGSRYRPDAHWDYVLTFDPSQEEPNFTQLDRRSAWFYEAVTASKGMAMRVAGLGQAYLGAYHDAAGNWFDGAKNYTLRVPPDAPAKQFWSLTIYDTRTRCLIDNAQGVADKSSRMPDLAKNPDGSVDLYIGPTAPINHERNWIPTVPGKAWFAYFRLYAPLQPYLDATWALPDIEEVK
jgi:hypothetical protein